MSIKDQKVVIAAILMCLLLAGIFYYYNNIKIPLVKIQIESMLRAEMDESVMPRRWVAVVTAADGISHYTEMTDEILNETITLMEVPIKYSVEGSISDLELIKGMITKYSLSYGQQLLVDQFYTEENWYGEHERLKEFEVASLVADEVKTGNIVDMIVNYGNGDYDVVVPKIKVRKIISNSTEENLKEKSYTIVLAVDEMQYRNLLMAGQLGELETRLYLDTNQPPSLITFNYQSKIAELRLRTVTEKNKVSTNVEDEEINYQTRDNN